MMIGTTNISMHDIQAILEEVTDPEIPVLSIMDLGIVRDVKINGDEINVMITPTYSGCPAMDMITVNIRMALLEHGYQNIKIHSVLSPAWTTDWMTEKGKTAIKSIWIAPPNPKQVVCNHNLFQSEEAIQCPHCNSFHTNRISEFGSTACKALYRCDDCKEPFDYFKCH
jgi:ring-1,2-phenylacetyl-CoA epoxidase subunit PaaD